jgi:antitoxin YefM
MYKILYSLEAPVDAVNYSDLRRNLKSYLDRVHDDRETLIVTRKNNENVVLISLEEYNSLVETTYLLSSDANAKHISESMREARAGNVTEHELIEE